MWMNNALKLIGSRLSRRRRPIRHLAGAILVLAGLAAAGAAAAQVAAKPSEPVILAFGDSLTAGFQLPAKDGFTGQLEAALRARGWAVRVHNAGVSGDTTAGGLARLGWVTDSVRPKPALAIVELGANDMLRGIDPAIPRANLDKILAEFRRRQIPVLLAGMGASRTLGPDYVRAFDSIYPDLAKKHGVPLYPFFLKGVAFEKGLLLSDGLHPNAKGVAVIVKNILPSVEAALVKAGVAHAPAVRRN